MNAQEFKPLKCLRRLMDYYLRLRVVEDLKVKLETFKVDIGKIHFMDVMLELKTRPKKPNNGYIYETRYILPLHSKIHSYFRPYDGKPIRSMFNKTDLPKLLSTDYEHHQFFEKIADIIERKMNVKYSVKRTETWREARDNGRLDVWIGYDYKKNGEYATTFSYEMSQYLYTSFRSNERIKGLTYYKTKAHYKTLNLRESVMHYTSILNLKTWSKTTKKPSSKGLKAIHPLYTYVSEGDRKSGWEFGGITADTIENLCLMNGFVKEPKKKYQYGDYAMWYMAL